MDSPNTAQPLAQYARNMATAARGLTHAALGRERWTPSEMEELLDELEGAAFYLSASLMAVRRCMGKPVPDSPDWLRPAVLARCREQLADAESAARSADLNITYAHGTLRAFREYGSDK